MVGFSVNMITEGLLNWMLAMIKIVLLTAYIPKNAINIKVLEVNYVQL